MVLAFIVGIVVAPASFVCDQESWWAPKWHMKCTIKKSLIPFREKEEEVVVVVVVCLHVSCADSIKCQQ